MFHQELTFKYAQAHASGISIHLRHLQAESDLRAMKSSALEKDQEIRDKAEELAEGELLRIDLLTLFLTDLPRTVTARTSALYHKATGLMQEAQEADDGAEPETKTEVAKYRDENDLDFGALTARVGALEAEYAMTTPVEPGLMAKYQNRKQEVSFQAFFRAGPSNGDLHMSRRSSTRGRAWRRLKRPLTRLPTL